MKVVFKQKWLTSVLGATFSSFSTGSIHSYRTRQAYQQHVLHFINWARMATGINRLANLDARADELAADYLQERVVLGKSAYTVQAERAALRLFFQRRDLAQEVDLPRRVREQISAFAYGD